MRPGSKHRADTIQLGHRTASAMIVLAAISFAGCDCRGGEGAVGELTVSPEVIDFGPVTVGLAGRRSLIIANKGAGQLRILEAKANAALAGEVRLDVVPYALPGGDEAEIPLVFTPKSSGARNGVIVIKTDGPTTPEVQVQILGLGIDPRLVATPDVVDFGRVTVGMVATATVTIKNVGSERVVVRAVTPDIDTSAELTAVLRGIIGLDPGQSFTLSIAYQPIDGGFDEGRFIIADDTAIPMRVSIAVRGEGSSSELAIDPHTINFLGSFVGETRTRFFEIKNLGSAPQTVSRIELVDSATISEFILEPPMLPLTLEPGQTERIFVTYAPIDAELDQVEVLIESPALLEPERVVLQGLASLPPFMALSVEPTRLSFGPVEIGTTAERRLRIFNRGNTDVHLIGGIAALPGTAPYTLRELPPANALFAPLDDHTLIVEVTPTALGPVEPAVIAIDSDDPEQPTLEVILEAEGVATPARDVEIDPPSLELGHVPRGERAVRSIVLRSTGSAPVTIYSVVFLDDGGGLFELDGSEPWPRTIMPGEETRAAIAYRDASGLAAAHAGRVRIDSDDADQPRVEVALAAETVEPILDEADLVLEASWIGGENVDLHLVRPGGAVFDRPSDVCFCSPNPDWGRRDDPLDDPFLERDDVVAPGLERIAISIGDRGRYSILVHHREDGGNGAAEVELVVRSRGVELGRLSRVIGGGQLWDVGNVDLSTSGFEPVTVPLSASLRDDCY
jgi:hypothetical protein